MNQELLATLLQTTPAEARQRLSLSPGELDAQVLQLAATLNGQGDSPERKAIFTYVKARDREVGVEAQRAAQPLVYSPEMEQLRVWVQHHYYPDSPAITPELREWACQTFNEEEFLAGLREIQTTGGLEFKDFIHELEQEVESRE